MGSSRGGCVRNPLPETLDDLKANLRREIKKIGWLKISVELLNSSGSHIGIKLKILKFPEYNSLVFLFKIIFKEFIFE